MLKKLIGINNIAKILKSYLDSNHNLYGRVG